MCFWNFNYLQIELYAILKMQKQCGGKIAHVFLKS